MSLRTVQDIVGVVGAIVLAVLAGLLIFSRIQSWSTEDKLLKNYQEFQKNTEVINGTVKKSQKESKVIFPDSFNIIVESKEGSKMIKVNEQQYRDYQPKNHVRFRIDKTDNNTVVRDLNNENDLDSLKKYEKYYKDSPARLFGAT